jgi:hypothetical protein
MAACKGMKLTVFAPVALAIAAIILGILAIFSTQWTTGHFIYHLRHNTTVGNRTVSELRLNANIGVAKLCYTLETEFDQQKDSKNIERITECQSHSALIALGRVDLCEAARRMHAHPCSCGPAT